MPVLRRFLQRLLLFIAFLLPRALRRRLLLRPFRQAQNRLLHVLRAPAQSQSKALLQIVEANRRTEFGRAHAFDQVQDEASFIARVPLRTYHELEPYILRQAQGEPDVLVAEPPLGFAISNSGGGRARPVPITQSSLEKWRWVEELLLREAIRQQPKVARGRALHLLPVFASQKNQPSTPLLPLPVLLEALGQAPSFLPNVVPWQIFSIADEERRFYLSLRLAAGQAVVLLRAASPGTLTLLAEHLERLGPKLVEDITAGRVEHWEDLPEEVRRKLSLPRPNRRLARDLQQCLRQRGRLEPRDFFPQLQLLVCATTGPSRSAAERLCDRFGSLPLLDPGHRGAEGIVTLPWMDEVGGRLALEGQYWEFLPAGASTTQRLETLRVGERVQPVVTGWNGLYRYLLEEVFEVSLKS
jgi:hypothetical protein